MSNSDSDSDSDLDSNSVFVLTDDEIKELYNETLLCMKQENIHNEPSYYTFSLPYDYRKPYKVDVNDILIKASSTYDMVLQVQSLGIDEYFVFEFARDNLLGYGNYKNNIHQKMRDGYCKNNIHQKMRDAIDNAIDTVGNKDTVFYYSKKKLLEPEKSETEYILK